MDGLTQRQRKALELILDSIQHRGYPPTIRELGEAMGIGSSNGVSDHLVALERKGFIERESGGARSIVVLKMPDDLAVEQVARDLEKLSADVAEHGPDDAAELIKQANKQFRARHGTAHKQGECHEGKK